MRRGFILALSCALLASTHVVGEPTSAQLAHFEEQIRPILVNRCYDCHSGADAAGSANLRLDYAGGWQTGGDSGPAIDSSDAAASLLLRAISYENPDLQMPPRSKLPERELKLLRDWVTAGAPAPEEEPPTAGVEREDFDVDARKAAHWVWQPARRPPLPDVVDARWPRDDLDRFVMARLEQAGLRPADEVDPSAWLRRVTFDLTGLPPTAEQTSEFLANPDEQARERVVDRLLASREFAECWTQHWLDLVRYAETKGHEGDYAVPHAWRYRDYVIRAFDANVPHDELIVEHIAGDLLPEPRVDPKTRTNQSIQGTGFWHLGEATHSPVDIRGEEADRIDNQIDVFSKAFLGLTVACARCHEHKFDAIGSDDYYALCGFLQSSSYQEANVADPELHEEIVDELRALNDDAQQRLLASLNDQAQGVFPKLEQFLVEAATGNGPLANEVSERAGDRSHPLHALLLAMRGTNATQRQTLLAGYIADAQADTPPLEGEVIVDFRAVDSPPTHDDWLTSGWSFGEGPRRVGSVELGSGPDHPIERIVEWPAASNRLLSEKLTGLYRTRTFPVTHAGVWYLYRGEADVFLDVDSHRTVTGPLHGVVRQKLKPASKPTWFRHNAGDYIGHRVHAEFKPKRGFDLLAVVVADKKPTWPSQRASRSVAKALTDNSAETPAQVAAAIVTAMSSAFSAIADGDSTTADAKLVNWLLDRGGLVGFETTSDHAIAHEYFQKRASLEAKIPSPQWALALLDGSGENEFVHLRGSHKRLADEPTPRRFLIALDGGCRIPQGSGRLELAHRVVDPANPLTARVHVNRVWAHLTGRGIVKTVDNFGVLGEPPTHPELLDYLADEFVTDGWDTKSLIRRIVLSSTYRQSTQPSVDVLDIDPANLLLHSARVRRLPAEAIRDALLAVAGELDLRPYGPSIRIHITDFMRHNRSPSNSGPLDGSRRRSIYVEVRRNALSHFLTAFDRPQPFTTVGLRNVSNSPAQPLTLLNDPLVHQLADKWAGRIVAEHGAEDEAIDAAFMTAFSRLANAAEKQRLLAFAGESPDRQQAWRDICLALFNSKEFVFLR